MLSLGVLALLWVLAGCSDPVEIEVDTAPARPAGIITLGDIDPDEPATRVRRIQPLADYLGDRLHRHGIGRGRVVVARDIREMARLMADSKVDLFLDSAFPVLAVNREAGSQSILLRTAKEDAGYHSVFIARADSGVETLADVKGSVVVFQEPHSTSGFLLPVSMLLAEGFSLQAVARLDSKVPADSIGCHFSGDEENTIELVLNGDAKVGAISNQDLRELPRMTRDKLVVVDRTDSAPRQLVAARRGLDDELLAAIRASLLDLTDADRERLAAQDAPMGWTWKFAELSERSLGTLAGIEAMMDALPACVAAR